MVYDPDLLELAYNNIKSKPGNMTPATNQETLDGVSKELFAQLATSLKNESFKFSGVAYKQKGTNSQTQRWNETANHSPPKRQNSPRSNKNNSRNNI